MGILSDLILIVLSGVLAGVCAMQLRQPMIVGYILVGILIGPNTGFVQVSDMHSIEMLAELGVALLLFALGIEISLKDLASVRKVALLGTPIQITLTLLSGYALGQMLGWPGARGLWFGGLIALSSTMVVIKTMHARGFAGTMSSRVMFGMLIVQDLAIVPLMILLPKLSEPNPDYLSVLVAMMRAAAVLAAIYLGGTRVIPRMMQFIAGWRSRELFTLTTIGLALGIGWLTHAAGLSFAFGAFVAGLVLSESEYGHQALGEVASLRDLFGLVFFTSIGMLLDPALVVDQLPVVLSMVALVMVGKGLIFAVVTRSFGFGNIVPIAAGLGLSQIGEFSFLLARVGVESGSIDRELFGLVISTAIITMLLTPYITLLSGPMYRLQRKLFPLPARDDIPLPEAEHGNHAIVVGGGRVGHLVAAVLTAYDRPFVVIDYDQNRVQKSLASGLPVLYGDASNQTILEAAGIARARLLIVTLPTAGVAREVMRLARQLRPDLFAIVRSETIDGMKELTELGANEIVQPEFEASLEIIRKALQQMDVPLLEIQQFVESTHRATYEPLAEAAATDGGHKPRRRPPRYIDMRWMEISAASSLSGKTIGELEIRRNLDVSIIVVVRGDQTIYNVGPESQLQAGDWLGLLGAAAGIAQLEANNENTMS